jgi:uncharacterized membrane protein YgdD (TMEM256/DUF423 family)
MHRIWIASGSFAGLTAVAMAAAAAHGLPDRLGEPALQMARNAIQMQGWHALALILYGVWAMRDGPLLVNWAGAAFSAGLLLFCGSVYLLALGGTRLPSVAPVGGTLLMAGWGLLGLAALRTP